jgi:hypothetical protein
MQFGGALHRLLHATVNADPGHEPVHMAKIDLSDAYMRIRLAIVDLPKLAFVVPPHASNPEPLIRFHLSLPMGYIESAPYFCASTETVANLINHSWALVGLSPALPLEQFTRPPELASLQPLLLPAPTRNPLAYIDVFVDGFLALCKGTSAQLRQVCRHIFHTIDLRFRLNDTNDRHWETPNSIKKLKLGDADWTTRKKLLGWAVNTVRCLVSLPPELYDKIQTLLALLALLALYPRYARRWTLHNWQILCGNLGLFSCLYAPPSRAPATSLR